MRAQNSNFFRGESARASAPLKSGAQMSTRETAQYIADMVLELRNMAKAAQLKSVQGLLEVAYYEAFGEAHKVAVPAGEADYLEHLAGDAKRAMSSV